MNLEITTGCSLETAAAWFRYVSRSCGEWATFIAAPESTYDGLTKHGKPTSSQNAWADLRLVSSFHLAMARAG